MSGEILRKTARKALLKYYCLVLPLALVGYLLAFVTLLQKKDVLVNIESKWLGSLLNQNGNNLTS